MNAVRLISSLLYSMGGLINFSSMLLVGLLNRSVAGPGNPGLLSVDLICSKDIHIW